jgi:Fusaric acid resistance protein-like
VMRALLGTTVGFLVGSLILVPIGTHTTLLWFVLPVAILFAGFAPTAISFAAGQAGFTLTLVILYNIIQPAGWRVGLVRVEDVAVGCAVSLMVGVLFWPRGAASALGQALAEAYADSARYLAGAVDFGMGRCDRGTPARSVPTDEALRAAAASRRLDDTFRGYLAERGTKAVPLAEVTGLVTGIVGLRLAADAVLDLWQRDDGPGGDRAAARSELVARSAQVTGWYEALAASLADGGDVPNPRPNDEAANKRLIDAVSHDLRGGDGRATGTAVRMIWTSDHLEAARRFEVTLVGPAQAAAKQGALRPHGRASFPWVRHPARPAVETATP